MLMKELFNLCRSKLLLFTLLAALVGGASPAWAETLTANFNSGLPEGWSIVGDLSRNSDRARSGSGVWTSSKSDNANYLVTEAVEGSITFYARAYNKNTNAYVFIYKYDGSALGEQLYVSANMKTGSTPTWSSYTANLGTYKGQVAIALNYAAIDDVTYTQKKAEISGPAFVVKDGEKELASPYTYSFGLATAGTTKEFTLSNPGNTDLAVSVSETGNFGATLSATTIAAGSEVTLTLTMPTASGSSEVTITPDATSGIEPFVINVSGTIRDENKFYETLTSGTKPDGWTAESWTFSSGYASTNAWYQSAGARLITPKLAVKSGELFLFEAIGTYPSEESYQTFVVEYSTDKSSWTASQTAITLTSEWTTFTVSDIPEGSYYIALHASQARVRNFYGGEKIPGANFAISIAEGAMQDFGSVRFNATAEKSYTITNNGDAELVVNFTNATDFYVLSSDGTPFEEGHFTVAAGGSTSIKVVMDTNTSGNKSGNIVLTFDALNATSFTIPCKGNVKDANLLFVDFDDPNAFPEGWQVGADWDVSASGYAYQKNTKTASALVTTPLTVANGETLSFKVARNASGYGNVTSLKTRYSTDGGATWSEYTTYSIESTALTAQTIFGIPAGTIILEFFGSNIRLDDIEGFTKTTAPALALTEGTAAVANGDTKDFGFLNADGTATYTVKNIGNATLKATIIGEGITVSPESIEVAAGETADITVTMTFAEPYTAKTGKMTIDAEGWVGDFVVNFAAELVDPTDFVEDFEDGKPEGWYSEAWTYNNGVAYVNNGVEKPMITEQLGAAEGKNVLSFDAFSTYENQTLNVYTSTDRKEWTLSKACALTATTQNFKLDALAEGSYYIKFGGALATTVDNIKGLKRLTAPEHDLYYVGATLPTDDITPIDDYTAKVKVASLRADETVAVELYFGETKVAEQTNQLVANGATVEFTLTGKAPAAGTFEVYAKVYNDDVNVETEKVSVTVAETTELAITTFAPVATAIQADEDNNFTADFNVVVKNNGSTPINVADININITDGEGTPYTNVSQTVEGDETILPNNATATIKVTVTAPANDGGNFSFKAQESVTNSWWTNGYEYTVTVKVTAAAIVLDETVGTVATGTNRTVQLKHTFVQGWNTICLPFSIEAYRIHIQAKALAFTAYNAETNELTFSPVTTLEAGKPYVIYVPTAITEPMEFNGITIESTIAEDVNFNGVTFQGTYAPMAAGTLQDKWGLTAKGKIAKAGDNTSMKGFRAYFDGIAPGNLQSPAVRFIGFDDASAISDITVDGIAPKDMQSPTFNLQGRRVSESVIRNSEMKKGLYIINHKKVIKK